MTEICYIRDDDELEILHEAGTGLIYNDFSGSGATGAQYNVLHAAWCSWVARSKTSIRKVFFATIKDAVAWLTEHRGAEGARWKRCGTCRAAVEGRSSAAQRRGSTSSPPEESTLASERVPFTEARVEETLVQWLEGRGFMVRRGVTVQSGIIDLVARNSADEWVIEVKGEDKGGYNTAEMNFRIGIGQISSRMEDSRGTRFALAIPMTPHFKRVLVKHRNFMAFEKMSLWLFVVEDTGVITALAPDAVQQYINELGSR